jgi:hypothetical protein
LTELGDAESRSTKQQAQLVELVKELEELTVRRLSIIDELANVRGVEFPNLCSQLDISLNPDIS